MEQKENKFIKFVRAVFYIITSTFIAVYEGVYKAVMKKIDKEKKKK